MKLNLYLKAGGKPKNTKTISAYMLRSQAKHTATRDVRGAQSSSSTDS